MPEATDKTMTPDPALNAELGKLLGATPAREWRVRMPDGELRWAASEGDAKGYAAMVGSKAELVDLPLPYDCDRDLMAVVEEELARRSGMLAAYGQRLAELVFDESPGSPVEITWGEEFFSLAHAPPDLRARAARDVLKAGEKP